MKLWKVLVRNGTSQAQANRAKQQQAIMELFELKSRSPTFSEDSGRHSTSIKDAHQSSYTTTVHLRKRHGESLGIVLTNRSSELEPCPSISSLRPGSVALHSDQLIPGDRVCSVNGINTSRMRPEEVSTLLDNVDGSAVLEVEYSLPNYGTSMSSLCVSSKITEITIERIDGSLGLTLRGGAVPGQPHLSRPLVVTYIRESGAAHRTGLVRVGDRLLKVDSIPLINKTLVEAQELLSSSRGSARLTIEYDVSVLEAVKHAAGPLLVEMQRAGEGEMGIRLAPGYGDAEIQQAGYYVGGVVPASTADRCGALHVGDQLLAIDDLDLGEWNGTCQDAEELLRRATKIQVLPWHTFHRTPSRNFGRGQHQTESGSGFSTLNSRRSRHKNRPNRQSVLHKSFDGDSVSNYCGCAGGLSGLGGVSHPETLSVILHQEPGTCGYGLSVAVGEHSEDRPADILISRIAVDSPAYRCGCLQVGDRIVSVNHQSNLTLQEIVSVLDLGGESNGNSKLTLQVEFDVADTIVPSSGIFTVKLPKRGPGLGITITASKIRPEEPFIISEIRRGSIAHRTGTLHAGDRLLEIDHKPLDHFNIEAVFEILQSSTNDIVTLKVEKTETENANLFLDSVVYTVELHKYGGPLGITIAGSEDCSEPIVLSRLTEGGLAEKTGALHVGDRILAINDESLEHRPLSEAIRLLQSSGDRVQLKISRTLKNTDNGSDESRCNYSSPGLVSEDSAVHSWDGTNCDNFNEIVGSEQGMDIKDEESILSEAISYQRHHDSNGKLPSPLKSKHDSDLQFYSDMEDPYCPCPSPLPLPNYNNFPNSMRYENSYGTTSTFFHRLPVQDMYSNESMLDNDIYHVTLFKDSIYDDYGFSVSDGLYEKGVYVNRIRKGGPADIVGLLKPYDRIIQVNDTKTVDFDCCLTVPLIASAGDRIELVIARNPSLNFCDKVMDNLNTLSKTSLSSSQNTITKTL